MLSKLRLITALILPVFIALPFAAKATEVNPIIIGLDADMSAGAARGGLAIQRGAEIAIDEINRSGGVLGRPLQLAIKDHRGNPARGAANIKSFAAMNKVVAVLGGIHTPVAMHELPLIHELQLIYLSPWAAGTPVVNNGYQPNYVFRVSVRDEYAGAFLIDEALKQGYRNVSLLLEKTGWGRSNEKAMTTALQNRGLEPGAISWFHWGTKEMITELEKLLATRPDVILLVANVPEGVEMVKALAAMPAESRVPVISHWGITGGEFFEQSKTLLKNIDLSILQTFSFIDPVFPDRANKVIQAYIRRYPDAIDVRDIFAPTGTAHAYDLIHLLALAIKKAATTDRVEVRNALETLPEYNGLLRNYKPPFSAERHDALDASDFSLSRYDENGRIVPLK